MIPMYVPTTAIRVGDAVEPYRTDSNSLRDVSGLKGLKRTLFSLNSLLPLPERQDYTVLGKLGSGDRS